MSEGLGQPRRHGSPDLGSSRRFVEYQRRGDCTRSGKGLETSWNMDSWIPRGGVIEHTEELGSWGVAKMGGLRRAWEWSVVWGVD